MKKAVYDVYVWHHGDMVMKAFDIVAHDPKSAAKSGVIALLRRRFNHYKREEHELYDWLNALRMHLYGYGDCPHGFILKVVHRADGPGRGPCVQYG